MTPFEPPSKDLRVLQIDRSQKDALDQKDKGNRGPLLYAVAAVVLLQAQGWRSRASSATRLRLRSSGRRWNRAPPRGTRF